jgi:hypothetical protein
MPWVVTEFQELILVFGTLIVSFAVMVVLGKWWAR